MEQPKESFWKRIRRSYRVSILQEETLAESWHVRLSWLGVFTVSFLLFILTIGILSLIIIWSPIRTILPGYSDDIRQQLLVETDKVDSLETSLLLQQQYLHVVKQVLLGEVKSDTIQPMDTMTMVMREQLLQAKSEAAQELVAEYEEKEKDQFRLFDVQNTAPVYTLVRPVQGLIKESTNNAEHQYTIWLETLPNVPVSAVLGGTIIFAERAQDNTFTIIIQHPVYNSVYYHISHPIHKMGDVVQAGECIGMTSGDTFFGFSLWKDGMPCNPEDVIAF